MEELYEALLKDKTLVFVTYMWEEDYKEYSYMQSSITLTTKSLLDAGVAFDESILNDGEFDPGKLYDVFYRMQLEALIKYIGFYEQKDVVFLDDRLNIVAFEITEEGYEWLNMQLKKGVLNVNR
jgi:hypothetical protein